jgi:hypothetical protein
MRQFFLFSISIAILSICGLTGFLVWKSDQSEKEKMITFKEKRNHLDDYYSIEFRAAYSFALDATKPAHYETWGYKWIEETEANMLKDGYDRAEINDMELRARRIIEERLERKEHLQSFK